MDTLDGLLRLLGSYLTWAKLVLLGNVVCIAAVLLLAPRSTAVASNSADSSGKHVLVLMGARLFPHSPSAEVQVSAFVNGTEFIYPSLAGVKWLKVAPTMASQTFKLPSAESYEVRFEMRKRESAGGQVARFASVETITIKNGPSEGTYRLHGVNPESQTRSGTIDAEIDYSFQAAN